LFIELIGFQLHTTDRLHLRVILDGFLGGNCAGRGRTSIGGDVMQNARVEIEASRASESIERADRSGEYASQHSENYTSIYQAIFSAQKRDSQSVFDKNSKQV